ncbi:MAG TPA: class I SAM-dependent methyltransferase [Dehalococcoidia bacterium]|nr:class I SAM-dependent methyltransferase [Dehalococcoidia bacterium]
MKRNEDLPINLDESTVDGFGDEWRRFQHENMDIVDREQMYDDFFKVFPWERLPKDAVGADVGCGSGRWAVMVAPQVGHLHLVDASPEALGVARKNMEAHSNCSFHIASLDEMPFPNASLGFAYSLGVLHHIPDTAKGIQSVSEKIKSGGIFLAYIYYKFDNRPAWFRALWKISDMMRSVICRMPYSLRYAVSQVLAALVYWPLSRTALLLEKLYKPFPNAPLFWYRNKSFYSLRTDALDRFGTRLEHRYTRKQIEEMLKGAGFHEICFSDSAPFWCVSAIKN